MCFSSSCLETFFVCVWQQLKFGKIRKITLTLNSKFAKNKTKTQTKSKCQSTKNTKSNMCNEKNEKLTQQKNWCCAKSLFIFNTFDFQCCFCCKNKCFLLQHSFCFNAHQTSHILFPNAKMHHLNQAIQPRLVFLMI